MRKFIILIMALCIWGVLSGEGWAAKINISGRHSVGEIKATCGAVGGSFFQTVTTAALTIAQAVTRALSSALTVSARAAALAVVA